MYSSILYNTHNANTSMSAILNRFATIAPKPWSKTEAVEWDPSKDEVVEVPVSPRSRAMPSPGAAETVPVRGRQTSAGRWGTIGGERRMWCNVKRIWAPSSRDATAPRWPSSRVFSDQATPAASAAIDKSFRTEWRPLTASFHPFNPEDAARREKEARQARAVRAVPYDRTRLREEMDARTEACNPFNPDNVAARAAAESELSAQTAAYAQLTRTNISKKEDVSKKEVTPQQDRVAVSPPPQGETELVDIAHGLQTPERAESALSMNTGASPRSDCTATSSTLSSRGSPEQLFCEDFSCGVCSPVSHVPGISVKEDLSAAFLRRFPRFETLTGLAEEAIDAEQQETGDASEHDDWLKFAPFAEV
ncbi:hypothetical protein BD413DRAFT_657200 [Trametes elegans]|nr:hypothetical protein BD413DRAFT_657200 [Trametes elegans]